MALTSTQTRDPAVTVCDVCGETSLAPRGAACGLCSLGVLRLPSELLDLGGARSRRRRQMLRAAQRDDQLS